MLRSLAAAVAMVVLLVSACGSGEEPRSVDDAEPLIVGFPYSDYAHEDEPFARDLFTEQATEIAIVDDPELFFAAGDTDLRYTTVTDGARWTPTSVPGAPVVWFFGGSTMFGIGQRDEHTIAAEVARLAASEGTPIDARNYGVSAYVAWQEAVLLGRLMAGSERPDLIVFLHGVNDYSQTCRHLAAGIAPLTRTNPVTDPELASLDEPPAIDCWEDPEATGEVIASVVDAAMAEARDHADGVPVVEFWQAMPQAREPSPSDEGLMERIGEDRASFRGSAAPYLAAIAADPTPGIDLTDVFDTYDGPVFFDWAHTNEVGAQLVAEAMWDRALRSEVQHLPG